MKRKNILPNSLTEWQNFYDEFQNESPGAAAIVASSFIDEWLRKLLFDSMVDDKKLVNELLGGDKDAPLSTFSARIKAAYCLGLISKEQYQDLNTIKNIRNYFAHGIHGITFDYEQIVSLCNSLFLPKKIFEIGVHFPKTHQNMFLLGVVMLTNELALKTLPVQKEKRIVPKETEMIGVSVSSP